MFRMIKLSARLSVLLLAAMLLFSLLSSKAVPASAAPSCSSPTVITGGGSFSISTTGTCFKYVNTTFVNGGMFSVMKDATSTSDTLQWYGGLDQNATSCANQTSTISGNGGQLNNFTIAKDSTGAMYLSITGSAANTVTIGIQNWQNGTGCSVKPTAVGSSGATATTAPTKTNTPVGPTATKTSTPIGPTATKANTATFVPPTATPIGPTATQGAVDSSLVGYATVNGTTTGGAGGATVTVSTLADLQADAASSSPMIIKLNGMLTGTGKVSVAANKTIEGVGASSGLVGIEISISTSNVIVRNLSISKVPATNNDGDAIHIDSTSATHIWIDHNDLSSDTANGKDFYDGLVDITHGADYVTVSWNYFHDHYKASLVGHSDSNGAEDTGHLHVTYHHNHFRNVDSRTPSIRFGTLHSYNNYFENFFDASTGISSRDGACSRIENDYFTGVGSPVLTTQSGTGSLAGMVQLIGNNFNGGTVESSPTCTLTVPYSYSAESASTVPTSVINGAGVGKINP